MDLDTPPFDLRDLEYALPEERIAQQPLDERDAARLLALDRASAGLRHGQVRDLPERLARPMLIVLNDTRVLPARLRGRKETGGQLELLLVERLSPPGERERWAALAKGKGLRKGTRARFGEGLHGEIIERADQHFEVELEAESGTVAAALAAHGEVPLPPYIRRAPDARDAARYQTVYAAHDGAVAAPTAGLHLSSALLEQLRARGHRIAHVTLHVGPGTFAPLRGPTLADHRMHPERYTVPESTARAIADARREGRPLLAVGTTVVRTLEAAADSAGTVRAGDGATSLFIYPPYRFRAVDALLTNFHVPSSTLLALVMAFGGIESVRRAYAAAIEMDYRFYSYGDAMLIADES